MGNGWWLGRWLGLGLKCVGCILWVVFLDLWGAGAVGNGWWLVAGVMAGAGAVGDGWWLGRWLVRCGADG